MMRRAIREKVKVEAPCLDMAGGYQTYKKYLNVDPKDKITVLDIISDADIVADLEDPLPIENERYKTILLFNALEHIYNYDQLLNKGYRILKPEGRLYIWIPFLINVHYQPGDYFRYTDKALERILRDAGFRINRLEAYGGLGLVLATYMGQLAAKVRLAPFVHLAGFGLNWIFDKYNHARNRTKWPLAYFVDATKTVD